MTQSEELLELAKRFSEGWHEGIKIDALDIELCIEAADRITTLEAALRQAVEALNTARPACFAENTLTAIDEALITAKQALEDKQ